MVAQQDLRFRPANLLNAAPDAVMAGIFLYAWIAPMRFGLDHTRGLLILMVMEFINLHSSAVMGKALLDVDGAEQQPRWLRLLMVLLLGVVYTVFVGGFACVFKAWWLLPMFWILTANRLMVLFPGLSPAGREKDLIQSGWAAGVAFYTLILFLSLLPLPHLGMTMEVRAAMRLPGGGVWIECPQNALAAGVFYFSLTAISECFNHRWLLQGTLSKGRHRTA